MMAGGVYVSATVSHLAGTCFKNNLNIHLHLIPCNVMRLSSFSLWIIFLLLNNWNCPYSEVVVVLASGISEKTVSSICVP